MLRVHILLTSRHGRICFTLQLLRCRDHSAHDPSPDDERGTRAGGKDGGDQSADGDLGVPAVAEAAVHSRDDEGGGGGCRLAAAAAERCGHLAALREAWSVPLGFSVSWRVVQKSRWGGGVAEGVGDSGCRWLRMWVAEGVGGRR